MNAVLSQEDIFNQNYRESKKVDDFNNLLKFASINGYLSEEEVESTISLFKECITNNVLANLVYDEEDDINLLMQESITLCYDSLNDYLISMNNPYKAIKSILEVDPNKLIAVAKEEYEKHQVETHKKVKELIKKSQPLIDCNKGFESLIDSLNERITNKKGACSFYSLMSGKDCVSVHSLSELDMLIEDASIEVDIINKFNISEVVRMLKSFTIADVTRNVTETALYNYVYNAFYKDGKSIDFTTNMSNIVARDIKMGLFDVEDVVEIITTGEVEFSEKEKEYILEHFVKSFKREVIENGHIDCFKRTKK